MCAVQLLRVSVHERMSAAAEDVLLRLEKGEEAALRALLTERLAAAAEEIVALFEETVAEYEDRVGRSEREICRQRRLLDALLKPEVRLHRAASPPDVQRVLVIKEEQQEEPHIKEEQEELWTSQHHQTQTEQTETGAGASSGPETDDSADWTETREPQSGSNSLKNDEVPLSVFRQRVTEKQFGCSECGRRFSRKSHLTLHMRIHTGEKPFGCSVCGKRFTQKATLTQHMFVHTGEKRYSCSGCDRRFTRRYYLKQHLCPCRPSPGAEGEDCGGPEPDRDSDPDPSESYSADCRETKEPASGLNAELSVCDFIFSADKNLCICSECGKRFDNKTNLKVHMIIHTQEKPFSCTACGKRFSQKPKLIQHMRRHSERKTHSCSVFQRRFTGSAQDKLQP